MDDCLALKRHLTQQESNNPQAGIKQKQFDLIRPLSEANEQGDIALFSD
jgi:hypothetical protein